MEYQLVYESTLYESNIVFLSIAIIISCIMFYYLFLIKTKREKLAALGIIFLITSSLYGEYEKIKLSKTIMRALDLDTYLSVEGKVENLEIMPLSGHKHESFKVENIYFEILFTGNSPKKKTIYYTLTKKRNGSIQSNRQKVKVYYLTINGENKIIKMWVAKL